MIAPFAVLLSGVSAQATTQELSFALTLSTTYGNGNSRPGLVAGAHVTGSFIWNTDDFLFVTSYIGSRGLVTVYKDPLAMLTYTAETGGASYTYTEWGFEPTMITGGPGDSADLQLWGGNWFFFDKYVAGYSGDTSMAGFLAGLSTGLTDGHATVEFGDGNWLNTVSGNLSSLTLTQIPEPSGPGIFLLGLAGIFAVKLRPHSAARVRSRIDLLGC